MSTPIENTPMDQDYFTDYALGIMHCKEGKKHESGSDRYNQGYDDQYYLEQVISHG